MWGATCWSPAWRGDRWHFNPRSPCGERQWRAVTTLSATVFQSTLPVWGATRGRLPGPDGGDAISIHAPRVGSDSNANLAVTRVSYFNPRSPCGERPAFRWWVGLPMYSFQSTLPVWGATLTPVFRNIALDEFQSTLPVWGATGSLLLRDLLHVLFQSTLPVWGATPSCWSCQITQRISIHAPRVGSDLSSRLPPPLCGSNFNPRSPCGERPVTEPGKRPVCPISIHAPRVGSDRHGAGR